MQTKFTKSFPAFISKTHIDGDLGIISAYVAVLGNIDLGDDIIMPGAFTKTISERASKIKVLDNHNSHSVLNGIGKLIAIQEVGKDQLPPELLAEFPDATGGLFVQIQFILEVDTDTSAQAFRLIKHGVINEYSIGFEIIKADFQDVETDEGTRNIRIIREIKLWEISPVIFAMNPATTTIGAKNDEIESTLETTTGDIEFETELSDIEQKESEVKISQKRIPDGYRMATDEKMCGNCYFFKQVTTKRGYCKYFDEVVLFNYVSDIWQPKARTLSDDMRDAFMQLLEERVASYLALGVYDDEDERRLLEMMDSLVAMLLEMIPSDLTDRPLPAMTMPKNKDESTQSKAESDNSSLTDDSHKKLMLSMEAEIRTRMLENNQKRRDNNGNTD